MVARDSALGRQHHPAATNEQARKSRCPSSEEEGVKLRPLSTRLRTVGFRFRMEESGRPAIAEFLRLICRRGPDR